VREGDEGGRGEREEEASSSSVGEKGSMMGDGCSSGFWLFWRAACVWCDDDVGVGVGSKF
jgi:hypothetical protein